MFAWIAYIFQSSFIRLLIGFLYKRVQNLTKSYSTIFAKTFFHKTAGNDIFTSSFNSKLL